MVFRQLATDVCAPVTNFKHFRSDWLLHKLLTSMFWTVLHRQLGVESNYYKLLRVATHCHCYNFYPQGALVVGFLVSGFFAASSDSNLGQV